SEKGKNVRQGHFLLYIHMSHGNTHNADTLHRHTFFSLFPAFFTTEYGELSRGRAGKTARACERRIFPDPDLRSP
ncbi:hypothetical protein, partial [Parabacteroides distasonis]|uniref:hypothetical protein n=1 Tax=Parabacteroides distasonis TaxID=823 RepID=UPI0019D522EC